MPGTLEYTIHYVVEKKIDIAPLEERFCNEETGVRSMRDEVKFLFSDILLYCNELDLLGGTTFAMDGCKLSSNASKEHSGTFAERDGYTAQGKQTANNAG
jgi:hypothetical protein